MDGKLLVEKLLKYAEAFLHLNKRDETYFRNLLLREFKLEAPLKEVPDLSYIEQLDVPDTITSELGEYAVKNELTTELEKELYVTFIMGILSPLPSEVNRTFYQLKQKEGIKIACKYFYDLSVKNDYVKKTSIAKNLKWDYFDGKRKLEITVNLSKPEKDNKEIAKLLTLKPSGEKYPECLLCKENEGFKGTLTHPARENIRTISVTLGGEPWFVQYSPYAYYNEHLIAINEKHVPMHVKGDTIDKLLDFVDYFNNYMIGSNASLPIIGGSILNHEHYQGGGYTMPMHHAPIAENLTAVEYANIKVGIIDWYNSAIRIEGDNREEIKSLVVKIINAWENYTDQSVGIYAETNGVKHNSLSPIVRRSKDGYIVDIIFRNNITTEEYPGGVFHAHPEYHNIKKEGIGLIEAMGLFILPGRLKKELEDIEFILQGAIHSELHEEDNPLNKHRTMIKELADGGMAKTPEEAKLRVQNKVGEICKNILINTAVFKETKQGRNAFKTFLKTCEIE